MFTRWFASFLKADIMADVSPFVDCSVTTSKAEQGSPSRERNEPLHQPAYAVVGGNDGDAACTTKGAHEFMSQRSCPTTRGATIAQQFFVGRGLLYWMGQEYDRSSVAKAGRMGPYAHSVQLVRQTQEFVIPSPFLLELLSLQSITSNN